MALGGAKPDESSSNSSSSSSSNSSSSDDSSNSDDSSKYPEFKERYPKFVVYRDESGNCRFMTNQARFAIEYKKKSEHSAWERHWIPDELEKWWFKETTLDFHADIVEEEFNLDLQQLLRESPEDALEAITEAAKVHNTDQSVSMTERCPVCREENHVITGNTEEIKNRRVCADHSINELKSAGLIN